MCGRYASSRRPQDLIEEFEVVDDRVKEPLRARLQRRAHQGGLRRRRAAAVRGQVEAEPPQRQLRALRWGLIPSWAKDPSIGNRMINARMETVAEKPAFRRAFASRRCLLPADGYFEWYPTDELGQGRQAAASSRSSSGRKDGGVARDGRPLRDLARPHPRRGRPRGRFRWTCTVITTEAEDDVGMIHDRMPLMVERDRWGAWLDPRRRQGRRCSTC